MSVAAKRLRIDLDNMDNVGFTEHNEDPIYTFRWNIKNFKERLQSTGPMELTSPLFTDFNDETKRLQWQLRLERIQGTDAADNFCIYLYLVNYEKATAVALKFDLLNSEKSIKTATTYYEFTFSKDYFLWYNFVKTATLLDPENKLLEDDTLQIRCRITTNQFDKNKKVMDAKAEYEKYAVIGKNYMASDIANVFNSSTLSDVSIKTKSITLKAHKIILSCQSPVFCDMFQNEITESINTVEILDFEPNIVAAMLKYIYCGKMAQDFFLNNFVAMLKIAVKYGIKGLKEDAGEHTAKFLSLENVVNFLISADKLDIPNLKAKAITFFNMNKAQLTKSGGTQKVMNYKPSLILQLYETY